MADSQLTIYPTLVISLGGTGTNVARYVKRRFLRTWNTARADWANGGTPVEDLDLPPVLQVLAIDTEPLINEPGVEPLYFHEFVFMGKFDATRLVQNRHNHQPFLEWWQWNERDVPLGYIHNGAKQLRPIGRLAFFRNYVTFKNRMVDKLNAMREKKAIQQAQELNFDVVADYRLVYIISSLCGGTGAGMFLDVAHVVRHYVGADGKVIGVFLMPSVFEKEVRSDIQRRRIKANAYAALKELNHFHTIPVFSASYPSEQGRIPTVPHKAFDQIFLIERTDLSGRTLSNKSEAEQMVAHMIHLTTFSHLNKRILGLDVNVTEEHTTSSGGVPSSYLSYSSFGVSALVTPHEGLWHYFVSRLTHAIADAFFNAPFDEAVFESRYRGLIAQLQNEFRKYFPNLSDIDNLIDERQLLGPLNALAEDLAQSHGRWLDFENIIEATAIEVFRGTGFLGLWNLIYRLQLRNGDTDFRLYDDLASEPNIPRPFDQRPVQTAQSRLDRLLGVLDAEGRVERRRIALRVAVYGRCEEVWRALLEKVRSLALAWEERFKQVYQERDDILNKLDTEVQHMADRVHPLRGNGDDETSTYYELETGAVGMEHLEEFWKTASVLLSEELSKQDSRQPWQVINDAIYTWLMHSGNSAMVGIRQAVEDALASMPDLHMRVDEVFDLRNVVYVQHGASQRPANYRIDQAIQKVQPHAPVDADTYPYTEADQEPIRLLTRPRRRPAQGKGTAATGADQVDRALDMALRGYTQFEQIEIDDTGRMDICYIVHGLPVSYLSSIPDMHAAYNGSDFDRRLLHLHRDWATQLTELYIPPTSASAQSPQSTGSKGATGGVPESPAGGLSSGPVAPGAAATPPQGVQSGAAQPPAGMQSSAQGAAQPSVGTQGSAAQAPTESQSSSKPPFGRGRIP